MKERAKALAETRQKIIEATMSVHDEQGMVDASWDEIARRAGVSLSTIYRHFESNEELVQACGALTFAEFPPPGSGELDHVSSLSLKERIDWLVGEVCGYWADTHPMMALVRRDAHRSEGVADGLARIRAGAERAVGAVVSDLELEESSLPLVMGLLDDRTWTALVEAGLTTDEVKSFIRNTVFTEMRASV